MIRWNKILFFTKLNMVHVFSWTNNIKKIVASTSSIIRTFSASRVEAILVKWRPWKVRIFKTMKNGFYFVYENCYTCFPLIHPIPLDHICPKKYLKNFIGITNSIKDEKKKTINKNLFYRETYKYLNLKKQFQFNLMAQ